MNCPKCNSPLKEGDKFCQVCGSAIENSSPQQPVPSVEPAVQEPVTNPSPVVQQPVVQPTINQPIPQQQPMGPIGITPQPEKKNNTIMYVLFAVIVVLVAVIIYLVVSGGKGDASTTTEETNNGKPKEEEVATANYTDMVVGKMRLKLLDGYQAEEYYEDVILYDKDDTTEVLLELYENYSLRNLDVEAAKLSLQTNGVTDVTYKKQKVNNKNMVIYNGTYEGIKIECFVIEIDANNLLMAEAHYLEYSSDVENDILDMLTKVTVQETTYSTTANSSKFIGKGVINQSSSNAN